MRTLDLGHAEAAGCSDPDQDYDDHRDDDMISFVMMMIVARRLMVMAMIILRVLAAY